MGGGWRIVRFPTSFPRSSQNTTRGVLRKRQSHVGNFDYGISQTLLVALNCTQHVHWSLINIRGHICMFLLLLGTLFLDGFNGDLEDTTLGAPRKRQAHTVDGRNPASPQRGNLL